MKYHNYFYKDIKNCDNILFMKKIGLNQYNNNFLYIDAFCNIRTSNCFDYTVKTRDTYMF